MKPDEQKNDLLDWLEEHTPRFTHMADQIWERPEILWEEFFASKLQADFLEEEGFSVEMDVAGMNTAFVAEYGEGKPVLAFIGEYDALPGLSQTKESKQEAVIDGGHGHGCGHNILGTAGLAAAVAVQKWMQNYDIPGTVRYYGCPAEEGGGGKVFMARDGLYDDLDAALTYHPGSANQPVKGSCVAINSAFYRFTGRSSHAGAMPELGRSALDAVELMNVGANYLREHVLDGTRIQYIITNGGQAANIVPETAEVHYILRTEKASYLDEVTERIRNIAKGAAMMTDTTFEETIDSGFASMYSNHYIADLMYEALEMIGPIEFTDEEVAFAQEVNDSFPGTNQDYVQREIDYLKATGEFAEILRQDQDLPLRKKNYPAMDANIIYKGATDVGDLSQVTPTGFLVTTCFPTGSPGHSWANTACGGMTIGHKGLMHAAKGLALTAAEMYTNLEHIEKAKQEFEETMGGRKYQPLIPEDMNPPRLEPKPA